jgi:hypothetical protein
LFQVDDVRTAVEHAEPFGIVVRHFLAGYFEGGLEVVVLLEVRGVGEDVGVIGMDASAFVVGGAGSLEGKGGLHREVVVFAHGSILLVLLSNKRCNINDWIVE